MFISFSFALLLLSFFNLFSLVYFFLKKFIDVEFFFKVWKLPVLILLIFFIFFVFVLSSFILKSDIVLFNIAELLDKSKSKFFLDFLKELFGDKILDLFCSILFFSKSTF